MDKTNGQLFSNCFCIKSVPLEDQMVPSDDSSVSDNSIVLSDDSSVLDNSMVLSDD